MYARRGVVSLGLPLATVRNVERFGFAAIDLFMWHKH
jgi:hypothetical protein